MRSRRITGIALSTLVAAGGLTGLQSTAAHATEPGSIGLLAVTGSGGGTIIANSDGTGRTKLNDDVFTAWSSDGTRLVYTDLVGYTLWTSDPDGGNAYKVDAPNLAGGLASWYDSNTKLVYASKAPGSSHSQLYVTSAIPGGMTPTPLFPGTTDTGYCDSDPKAFGQLVVFNRVWCGDGSNRTQVMIYNPAMNMAFMVADHALDGDISPDGTKIVFAAQNPAGEANVSTELYDESINSSGQRTDDNPPTRLTTSGGNFGRAHGNAAWSPDGSRIAFAAGLDVWMLDPASGGETQWMTNGVEYPTWQPVNANAPKAPAPGPLPKPVLTASIGAPNADGLDVVTLDATGTTGDDVSYSFDFGDGTAPIASATPVVTVPKKEGTYKITVTATDKWGRRTTTVVQFLSVGDGYHPVTPTRLLDTRIGLGVPTAGKTQHVTLQLPPSVLNNAQGPVKAVALNVTVTDATSAGNVKAYPHGQSPAPTTSNLNFTPGLTVANLVTVPVIDGKVQIDVVGNPLSLIADLSGYYTGGQSGSGIAPLTPTRLLDTRDGTGNVGRRVAAYGTVSLPVPSTVPADATAVVMNVTAVSPSASGDLDVYPDVPGQGHPTISNLNFGTGAIVPNLVIVPISPDRKIEFYNHSAGSTDMLADIEGYFSPSATSKFVPGGPLRLVDTRGGSFMAPGEEITLTPGPGDLPEPPWGLTAGLYNLTVTGAWGAGHISVFPAGNAPIPTVSNLNYGKDQTVANAVLTPLSEGYAEAYDSGAYTHLIVDYFGYFAKPLVADTENAAASPAAAGRDAGTAGHAQF